MSPGSSREREEMALDALIVSQLRRHGCEGDAPEYDELPELTALEEEALEALGPDFVEQLLSRGVSSVQPPPADCPPAAREPVMAGDELPFGLNRAEQIEPESAEELERRRSEIVERLRRRRDGGDEAGV